MIHWGYTKYFPLTNKFHFPDSVGKKQCIRGQERHLGHHLAKYGLHAVCSSQATSRSRTFNADAIQLHNGSVLTVPHHGGLNHLLVHCVLQLHARWVTCDNHRHEWKSSLLEREKQISHPDAVTNYNYYNYYTFCTAPYLLESLQQ